MLFIMVMVAHTAPQHTWQQPQSGQSAARSASLLLLTKPTLLQVNEACLVVSQASTLTHRSGVAVDVCLILSPQEGPGLMMVALRSITAAAERLRAAGSACAAMLLRSRASTLDSDERARPAQVQLATPSPCLLGVPRQRR